MDPSVARNIAHANHAGQADRFFEPVSEHVERVAASVAEDERTVAYLHDVLERTEVSTAELVAHGATPTELAALELLTRTAGESYEAHMLRIAHARGAAGRLARRVKLADLNDHLDHAVIPDRAPPYAWARRHLLAILRRRGERALGTASTASGGGRAPG